MISNLIKRNALLKILSLGIAFTLWFFVVSSKRSETIIEVPLRFINISPSLEILDTEDKTVSIRIEGQERLLSRLKRDDVSVVINLKGYNEGRVSYHISEDNVDIPRYLTVKNVYPSKIGFTLRRIKEKG